MNEKIKALLKIGSILSAVLLTLGCNTIHETLTFDNGNACIDYLNDAPLRNHNDKFELPEEFVDLRTEEGQKRIKECTLCDDYPALSTAYLTQSTQTFCGVASSTMILNADEASRLFRPVTTPYEPYHFYTQCNLLNDDVQKEIKVRKILEEGLELSEIHYVLSKQPSVENVQCYHATSQFDVKAGDVTADVCAIEEEKESALGVIKKALETKQNYVILNFAKAPYPSRGGHFSPISAYHEATDSFLIMDVARYKYPPFWIKANTLWESIKTTDSSSGLTRGFLVVSTKTF